MTSPAVNALAEPIPERILADPALHLAVAFRAELLLLFFNSPSVVGPLYWDATNIAPARTCEGREHAERNNPYDYPLHRLLHFGSARSYFGRERFSSKRF